MHLLLTYFSAALIHRDIIESLSTEFFASELSDFDLLREDVSRFAAAWISHSHCKWNDAMRKLTVSS